MSNTAQKPPEPFTVELTLDEGYAFTINYPGTELPPILVDELPPIGAGRGPNPARLLVSSIGHCLGASLLFCLAKSRVPVAGMTIRVESTLVRNEAGRLRVGPVRVRLAPGIAPEDRQRINRCLEVFEDYCIVTGSLRNGLDIAVEVQPD